MTSPPILLSPPVVSSPPTSSGLKRTPHWATREFHTFLESNASTPFEWGVFDCALFAASGIQAMTGVDIASDYRVSASNSALYCDEESAARTIEVITGVKGGTIEDAAAYCANKYGLSEVPPLYAQRGDLVVLEESGRLIAGLIHLSGRHVVCAGEHGLKRILIHDGTSTPIKRAWRVG